MRSPYVEEILPIGGLKEKILAARMAHMKKVLVPDEKQAGYGRAFQGDHKRSGDRLREKLWMK